jgi:two-component system sensor histidine kinase DesK
MTMRLLPNDREEGWTPYAWLIYLIGFMGWPAVKHGTTPLEWMLTFAGLVVFLALYFRGHWVCDRRELLVIIAAITFLGAAYWNWNPGAGSFFIYAAAFAGRLQPVRLAVRAIAIIEIVVIIETFALHIAAYNFIWPIVFCLLIGAITIHQSQQRTANAKLRLAHEEIEHLAKLAERERIARDLHDLLGHTLSLIVLKSELATKLAERDVQRAIDEIRDVERISRDALAQVRVAVRGYRSGGLMSEIDSARATLATANVDATIDVKPQQFPATHEVVLALAVREAVTNIVRHARATHCRIALDGNVLTISDDGVGGHAPFGSGLAGMRERVIALGGTLTRDGDEGTTLTIAFPQIAALGTHLSALESA